MAVLKYFDPLVITVVSLLEPLISIVIGCILGMAPVPGLGTWIGGTMMIVGAFGVTDTGETKETVDATDAIVASSPSRPPPPKDRMNRLARFDRSIEMQTVCTSPSREDEQPVLFSKCAFADSSSSDNGIESTGTSVDASDRDMHSSSATSASLRVGNMASGDFQGGGKVNNTPKKRKKRGHDKARVLNHI
jgi:hypothetical protein